MSTVALLSIITFVGLWALGILAFGLTFEVVVVSGFSAFVLSIIYYLLLLYVVVKQEKED